MLFVGGDLEWNKVQCSVYVSLLPTFHGVAGLTPVTIDSAYVVVLKGCGVSVGAQTCQLCIDRRSRGVAFYGQLGSLQLYHLSFVLLTSLIWQLYLVSAHTAGHVQENTPHPHHTIVLRCSRNRHLSVPQSPTESQSS